MFRRRCLIFGAGISGADNTHSGTFDMTMFANHRLMTCLAPTQREQMLDMLPGLAARGRLIDGVTAIRMPRRADSLPDGWERSADMAFDPAERAAAHETTIDITGDCPSRGTRSCVRDVKWRFSAWATHCRWRPRWRQRSKTTTISNATLIDAQQYSAMDGELLDVLADGHRVVVTLEDGQLEGGWGRR